MTHPTFPFGKIQIDTIAYASQGSGVLGIKDSGKTYTATYMAERLFDAGVPFIAFDPIGVWRFMRVPGRGRGYPIVVAGGQAGDLRLSPATAPAIVEAAMRDGISLVIDLFSMDLSKADWRKIVRDSVHLLLHKNAPHGLRHVYIEEAAEFVPQRVVDGLVYAEVEKLCRMGGNARLGYTLINQRAEEVNKAVLELCDNLFLHRQKGRNSLTALSKWLDIGNVKDHRDIIDTLATLPTGECWAWLAETPRPIHVKVPAKQSLHPDRRIMRGDDTIIKAAVDVASFVEKMAASLVDVEAEAKENDPKLLRQEIARLRKQLSEGAIDARVSDAAEERGFFRASAMGMRAFLDLWEEIRQDTKLLKEALYRFEMLELQLFNAIEGRETLAHKDSLLGVMGKLESLRLSTTISKGVALPSSSSNVLYKRGDIVKSNGENHKVIATSSDLKRSLQRVIDAIAWWHEIGKDPVDRDRACVVAGFSPKASTFGVYLAELQSLGMVERPEQGKIRLTAKGHAEASVSLPRTHEGLKRAADELLKPQARKVFDVVYTAYPTEVSREKIAKIVGLSPTASTVGVYLSEVAAFGIIENASRGHVKAADWLFP